MIEALITSAIRNHVEMARGRGETIGFVPTMGALHSGHISLVNKALTDCDWVVSSIFVNPTQFNDPKDLIHYPRTPESDWNLLEQAGCDEGFDQWRQNRSRKPTNHSTANKQNIPVRHNKLASVS